MVWALGWLGCGGGGATDAPKGCVPPVFEEGPTWHAAPEASGIRFLHVRLDRRAEVVVRYDDDGIEQHRRAPVAGRNHDWALVGLPQGEASLVVDAVGEDGCVATSDPLSIEVAHAPGLQVDVLELDAEAMGDAWTVFTADVWDADRMVLVVLDEQGRVVWSAEPPRSPAEIRVTPALTFQGTVKGHIVEVDLAGAEVSAVAPEAGPLHHDAVPLPDGSWWTLVDRSVEVDAYPVAHDALDTLEPAVLRDHLVLRMDAEGRTLQSRAVSDLLDTERVSFNSHDTSREGLDWCHGNGLSDDGEGGVWVSLRHQDAVVHLDEDLGLVSILGDHGGWRPPWDVALLEPSEGTRWPYQPHAPEVLADGTLVLFDNHNFGGTPYDPPDPDAEQVSRAVAYRIEGGEVTQVWERHDTATGPLFSGAVGDVDVDEEGRVVADFGFVLSEDGRSPTELGLGEMVARFVGWDAQGERHMDLRVGTVGGAHPGGLFVYRLERFAPLHTLVDLPRPANAVLEEGG